MAKKKDVVIIGSGVGGSAVGALLANNGGFNVTLIEKSDLIGGRFATFKKDGFKIDVGCHMLANCDKGKFGKVLDICGCPDYIKWKYARNPSPVTIYKGEELKFPHQAHKIGFTQEDLQNLFRFYMDINAFTEEDCDKHDNISVREFVERYIKNETAIAIVSYFAAIYFVTRAEETPLGEYVRCQNEIGRNKALGYPLGGTGAVPEAYCRIIKEKGGKVLTGKPVKRIIIENARATGIELGNGEKIKADIIISNAGIKETVLDLAGIGRYSEKFIKKIKSYRYTASSFAVKIALDKPLFEQSMIYYLGYEDLSKRFMKKTGEIPEEASGMMIPIISNIDPGAAPAGKQIIIAGGGDMEAEHRDKEFYAKWERAIINGLKRLKPDIEKHIIWKMVTTPEDIADHAGEEGNVIGVAQILGQVGKDRPPMIDPEIKELYHCSADTGVHGIGGELAMDSAFRLYDHLTK